MKNISCIIYLIVTCMGFSQDTKDTKKSEFPEYYRIYANLRKEFPNNLEVKVIFFDLDQDGKKDALATSHGSFYEDGWLWCAFAQNNEGKWHPLKGKDETTGAETAIASLVARPVEFYRLEKANQNPELILIRKLYNKNGEIVSEKSVIFQIQIGENGFFEMTKISMPIKDTTTKLIQINPESFLD